LAFFFTELSGVLISIVMLSSHLFNKATAYLGIVGFGLLLTFEIFSSFVAGLTMMAMALAIFGGLLSMAWYILIAVRLFQLEENPAGTSPA
jgi:hypothetical protein